jgi:DNA ligase-1
MPTSFKLLADLCEKLEATKKRLLLVDLVADFLKTLEAHEIEPAISMILGRPFPKWSQKTLDVSWTTLSGVIKRITGADDAVFSRAFSSSVDAGQAVKMVFEECRLKRQTTLVERSLTIMEVRRSLEAIAEAYGQDSREKKERLVEALFSLASPLEVEYLVKIIIGGMRTGFYEGLMEQAVAKAFDVSLDDVQRASMTVGDISEVAAVLKAKGKAGLAEFRFRMFRPVNLMLAQMADSIAEALQEHGGKSAFEYKYDGARVQVHKSGDEVRIFSRRLTEVTKSLPEIVDMVRSNVRAGEAILEGEVVAVDGSGRPIPFQHLMRRFRRVQGIEDAVEKIPLKLYLFDILYADGESLVTVSYVQRRQLLSQYVEAMPLTEQLVTDNVEEAEEFLKKAMDAGHEGLMAKKLDSDYAPGVRGKRWLKIKPILEPLDLVLVAAEYGYGRRHGWLSDYYLAARDAETGEFVEVGKTFKGLTDVEIVEMTKRLKEIATQEQRWGVSVLPKIVVEVAYNEIQESPKYKCGMTLRFARIIRIRDDKTPEEADTIQRVREIYERQFLKKGKLKSD